jgi:hypothetical protein
MQELLALDRRVQQPDVIPVLWPVELALEGEDVRKRLDAVAADFNRAAAY